MTDKETIIRILEEFKWGKLTESSIASTCPNTTMRVRPCCAICPACNCHKKTEEVAGQIVDFLTRIVKRRIGELEPLYKEHNKLKKQCPWCGESDMYRHYVDGPRHYRLCKWCGMLQNMGEKAQQCTLIQCVLDGRHRYWTVDPHKKKKCVHCGGGMKEVTIPKQDLKL